MNEKVYINEFCRIIDNIISVSGKKAFEAASVPFETFIEKAYRHFQIEYPKFFKMDSLSKLGFLTAELLLKNINLKEKYQGERIGIIISNKSSCLDTDVKYYEQVKKGIASPAVFVYTLPNILIGEICIRHSIKGENTFFISEHYDAGFQVKYVNSLFETGKLDACVCGWVELMGEEYDSFLYLAERNEKPKNHTLIHSAENAEKLYNQK